MCIDKNNPEQSWISIILRVAVALMFVVAAIGKLVDFNGYVAMTTGMFKDTILPGWLLTPYIYVLPFAEALIPVWLLVGFKLRAAWIYTAVVLTSLMFGLLIAKQNVADMFLFILVACVGLYMSKYDKGFSK